jgi:hypothetical protein
MTNGVEINNDSGIAPREIRVNGFLAEFDLCRSKELTKRKTNYKCFQLSLEKLCSIPSGAETGDWETMQAL